MLDMNDLKTINDIFGHRFGDAALVEMSYRLKACTRPTDVVARLGGDEFAIIMKFAEQPDIAAIVARMKAQINKDFVFEDFHRKLSMSVGYGIYPTEELNIELLLHRADLRMYADKHASKYKVVA
jgi:diguanylate cyclase (GGDEF)-like protein